MDLHLSRVFDPYASCLLHVKSEQFDQSESFLIASHTYTMENAGFFHQAIVANGVTDMHSALQTGYHGLLGIMKILGYESSQGFLPSRVLRALQYVPFFYFFAHNSFQYQEIAYLCDLK